MLLSAVNLINQSNSLLLLVSILFRLLRFFLLREFEESAARILEELLGRVVLQDCTFLEIENTITLDDRVETMGDRQDSGTQELLSDESLDGLLGDNINVGGGLIKDHNLVVAKDGTNYANELTLAHTQVLTLRLNLEFEALAVLVLLVVILLVLVVLLLVLVLFLVLVVLLFAIRLLEGTVLLVLFLLLLFFLLVFLFLLGSAREKVIETSLVDKLHDTLVSSLVEWIQVVPERAREQRRLLRNHRDLSAKIRQQDLADVDAIDLDAT